MLNSLNRATRGRLAGWILTRHARRLAALDNKNRLAWVPQPNINRLAASKTLLKARQENIFDNSPPFWLEMGSVAVFFIMAFVVSTFGDDLAMEFQRIINSYDCGPWQGDCVREIMKLKGKIR